MENLTPGGPVVNPLKYPLSKCEKCGYEIFEEKMVVAKIPGVVVGNGKDDVNYPIPILVCSNCGAPEASYQELLDKAKAYREKHESTNNKSGLII